MTRRYIYDPGKNILMVFEGTHHVGGYMGKIAERKFESLLMSGTQIELGRFLTRKELYNQKDQSL